MAVTVNKVISTGTQLSARDLNKGFVLENTIDTSVDNVGAGDTAAMIFVPAGTFVDKVVAVVDTAEGGTLTFDVGSLDAELATINLDGFIDGANGNAIGGTISGDAATAEAYANGLYFGTDGYIGITCVNAADAAVISVSALAYDVVGG